MGRLEHQSKEKYLDTVSKKKTEDITEMETHNLTVVQTAMDTTVTNLLSLRGHDLKAYNKVLSQWKDQHSNFLEVLEELTIKTH